MAGKNSREAADAFLLDFKQTLGCITDSHILPSGYTPEPHVHSVTLLPPRGGLGEPVPLRLKWGKSGLSLFLRHEYMIHHVADTIDPVRPWKVSKVSYAYGVQDEQDAEILSYHWHPRDPFQPTGESKAREPHLHLSNTIRPISPGRDYKNLPLADLHVRTGRVLLEDVVEFLIAECGVEPLRENWQEIVAANRARMKLDRTW